MSLNGVVTTLLVSISVADTSIVYSPSSEIRVGDIVSTPSVSLTKEADEVIEIVIGTP